MITISETTTDLVQDSIDQTKELLMGTMYELVKYALILGAIGAAFLILKFIIIKALNNKKGNSKSKNQKNYNDEGREYYLDKDELEAIRLYSKLTEEDKKKIKLEMKEIIRK